jgi:hypothetical protein
MRSTEGAFRASLEAEDKWQERSEDEWNRSTRTLNNWAIGSLIVGVAMFAVFAGVNLPWQGATEHESAREAGAATEPAAGITPAGARTTPEGSGDDTAAASTGPAERTEPAADTTAGHGQLGSQPH